MSSRSVLAGLDLHAIQQVVKWIVYAILIVNFFFYVQNDIEVAVHGLRGGGSFLCWTTTFATTIDELGWLIFTVVDQSNCSTLSAGTVFFPVDSESLVTDTEGRFHRGEYLVVDRVLDRSHGASSGPRHQQRPADYLR